ncbi:hypothetical protein [uncultured Ruminococcus sp.]|uniref:hypothetical protein n=1 Tax=uncultured Ruminococcus sp. TaxID=165186 RepID=UPI0025D0DCE7|nr:hypothetical protein [uncultured Ruminococcus sp.]
MFDLVTRLNEECGVRLPEKDDQDWEFCAGDYTRTEDYIEFYKKYSDEMDSNRWGDKELLSNMIIQGLDDMLSNTHDNDHIDKLWLETRKILLEDELYNVIVYWSCVGQPAEYCFLITPRMREVLRELI